MLLQRLCEYAERRPDVPPPMYQRQPVRYIIDLDGDGRLLGIIDTADPASRETRRGVQRFAPHVVRTSGVRAKLLVDKGSYVFGYVPPGVAAGRERREHEAFIDLVRHCAAATAEPSVHVVASFLDGLQLEQPDLPPDFDSEAQLTFRVGGTTIPIDLPSVRDYWAVSQAGGLTGEAMGCMVCGQVRPIALVHSVPIKRIPNGQTSGNQMISANARAFESYGLGGSQIAPTCLPCAEKYGNALNALLGEEATHLRVADVVYAFWTPEPAGFRPGRTLSAPDPTEVRQLIGAARSGRAAAIEVDATAFYAVGLGASGSRVVVRDWIDTTVGEAKRRLGRYFELQELVGSDGAPGEPLPIWRLANATVRDPRKEAAPAAVPSALLGLALGGTPPPLGLLFQAVRRCRAEQGVTRERAALIKMVLGSRHHIDEGGTAMTELDVTNTTPAYLCGRLLAILDAVQQRALNNPNATIVDKYYGTASSAPATVFGTLLHGAQAHLGKLRKDPRTQAAHAALERRLEEVMAPLTGFPPTLTLQEQGLFALGFYHQRAADRKARRERAQQRAADGVELDAVAPLAGMSDDAR